MPVLKLVFYQCTDANPDILNFNSLLTLNNVKTNFILWTLLVCHCFKYGSFDHVALFSAVQVQVLLQLNIWLVNFLRAKYSDEYLAGWHLVTHSLTEYILKWCMLNFMLLPIFYFPLPLIQ